MVSIFKPIISYITGAAAPAAKSGAQKCLPLSALRRRKSRIPNSASCPAPGSGKPAVSYRRQKLQSRRVYSR